jgi:hypothetical protein
VCLQDANEPVVSSPIDTTVHGDAIRTSRGVSISSTAAGASFFVRTEDIGTGVGRVQMPQPVVYSPSVANASSIFETTTSESDDDTNVEMLAEYEGYDSPPPANERLADLRNERRYRLILEHEFHRSCMCFDSFVVSYC